MEIIDLSREILKAEVYPGDPKASVEKISTVPESAFALSVLHLPTHAGTHVDAPPHYLLKGGDIAVSKCFGPCVVIPPERFYLEKAVGENEERILIKGMLDLEEVFEKAETFPDLLGVESLSAGSDALHKKLLSEGTVILEGLDMQEAPYGRGIISALPLKISGLDGSPVRACLLKTPESKKAVRRNALKKRDGLTEKVREKKSAEITEKLVSMKAFAEAKTVFAFMSFRSEVDTTGVIKEALRQGKNVAVPKVEGKEMQFYRIHSGDDLEAGAYGIPEPVCGLESVYPSENDIVIFPGAAFDEKGHRIGYGGGFYDRYFEKHFCATRIAVAFEEQIAIGEIPFEETDRPVTHIVSDRRIVKVVD